MDKELVKTRITEKQNDSSEHLLREAKVNFKQMQRGWWSFARSIHDIKKEKAYEMAGYESFRDYCEKEFPTMNYVTLFKYVAIVEYWQDTIETKMAKDPNFTLPAYETCYSISTLQLDKVSKDNVNKLKKQVIDSKITYSSLREKIKGLTTEGTEDESSSGFEHFDAMRIAADDLTQKLKRTEVIKRTSSSLRKLLGSLETLATECDRFIAMSNGSGNA